MTTESPYDDGDVVHVTGTFTDEGGAPQDPAAVFAQFRFGSGATTTKQYGVDTELEKDSVGNYSIDIDTTGHGGQLCFYRFYSTGSGQAAEQGRFYVERLKVGT